MGLTISSLSSCVRSSRVSPVSTLKQHTFGGGGYRGGGRDKEGGIANSDNCSGWDNHDTDTEVSDKETLGVLLRSLNQYLYLLETARPASNICLGVCGVSPTTITTLYSTRIGIVSSGITDNTTFAVDGAEADGASWLPIISINTSLELLLTLIRMRRRGKEQQQISDDTDLLQVFEVMLSLLRSFLNSSDSSSIIDNKRMAVIVIFDIVKELSFIKTLTQTLLNSVESVLISELGKFYYLDTETVFFLIGFVDDALLQSSSLQDRPLEQLPRLQSAVSVRSLLDLLRRLMICSFFSGSRSFQAAFSSADLSLLLNAISRRIAREVPLFGGGLVGAGIDLLDCNNMLRLCKMVRTVEACMEVAKIIKHVLDASDAKICFQIAGVCEMFTSFQKENVADVQLILKLNSAIKTIIMGNRSYKREFILRGTVELCNRCILAYAALEGDRGQDDTDGRSSNSSSSSSSSSSFSRSSCSLEVLESFFWIIHLLSSGVIDSKDGSSDCASRYNKEFTSPEGLQAICILLNRSNAIVSCCNGKYNYNYNYNNRQSGSAGVNQSSKTKTEGGREACNRSQQSKIATKVVILVCYTVYNVALNGHIQSSIDMYLQAGNMPSQLYGIIASSRHEDAAKDAALETIAKLVVTTSTHVDNSKNMVFWNRISKNNIDICQSFKERLVSLGTCEIVVNHACKAHTRCPKMIMRAAQVLFILFYSRRSEECISMLRDIGAIFTNKEIAKITDYEIEGGEGDYLADLWAFDFVRREDRWARRKLFLLAVKERLAKYDEDVEGNDFHYITASPSHAHLDDSYIDKDTDSSDSTTATTAGTALYRVLCNIYLLRFISSFI